MNIFRILAQGDGSINEPNISAFLGYLLNPNEDHGLGSYFLEQFLEQHFVFCNSLNESKNEKTSVNSIYNSLNGVYPLTSKFEIKVFFEQAFKDQDDQNKEVVDIILLLYKIANDGKTETQFINYLKKERDLEHIFLIEVKVKDTSTKKGKNADLGQLEKQIEKSRDKLKTLKDNYSTFDFENKLSAIFVSTGKQSEESNESDKAQKAFVKSYNYDKIQSIPKSHIFWNKPINTNSLLDIYEEKNSILYHSKKKLALVENTEEIEIDEKWRSIQDILNDMIFSDSMRQMALPPYTIDTIKSFLDFIYCGFSYKIKMPPIKARYKDFEEFSKNCSAYLALEKNEIILNIHNQLIHHLYKYNRDERRLDIYSTNTIRYNAPKSNTKAFHISIKGKNKLQIFYKSNVILRLNNVFESTLARTDKLDCWIVDFNYLEENIQELLDIFNKSINYTISTL